jgi:glutaconate CoA-transferase subunit B
MKTGELAYSYKELMVIVLARDLKDGEVGHVGMAGGIPAAACLLAQKLHAPNLTALIAGFVNPKPRALHPCGVDSRNYEGSEAVGSGYDTFSYTESGLVDFMFYSGIQIDVYGNFNLTMVGSDMKRPKFRGPGIPNTGLAVTAKRFYLYHEAHTRRNLVEGVDFISGAGNIDGPDGGKKVGIHTEGPRLCVTQRAVMDFDEATGRMRLMSIHEGVLLDDVVGNTGFALIMPQTITVTPPPTDEELSMLRTELDTLGILR